VCVRESYQSVCESYWYVRESYQHVCESLTGVLMSS